jgi:hypothetical protein
MVALSFVSSRVDASGLTSRISGLSRMRAGAQLRQRRLLDRTEGIAIHCSSECSGTECHHSL